MIDSHDLLADRVAEWTAQVNENANGPDDRLSLQGWGLYEIAKRLGAAAQPLMQSLEPHLETMPTASILQFADHATRNWNQLLTDLDRESPNFEQVRHETQDVFFSILEALALIEEAGQPEHQPAAHHLFNAIINDLYVFEPLADFAAELQRPGHGPTQLSDLLCTGIAGLFDGQLRVHPQVTQPVEEFVPLETLRLDRLAGISWWYVKWAAQRIRMTMTPPSRDLRLEVFEGDPVRQANPCRALDGWEIRMGQPRNFTTAAIVTGAANLKLPDRLPLTGLLFQIKSPGNSEWADLFTRLESQSAFKPSTA